MRLLNTRTIRLEVFVEEPFPKYAILSHRWEKEEVSFQELESGSGLDKSGYRKILAFCEKARSRGLEWCWVDTCAIDKTSSAELSEAINSMYKWYEDSSVCFAYLSDVELEAWSDGMDGVHSFNNSCWFTRGWTLQELLAPRVVEFYTSKWDYIGDKNSMAKKLSAITKIGKDVLFGSTTIQACSVATIMSWASNRVTTRKEDIAYCLLGLFQIHMPLLYGEGDRAFYRLQEEILKQSSDQSLFAWNPCSGGTDISGADSVCGILASSPACFADTNEVQPLPAYWDTESTLTNRGVRIRMPLKYESSSRSFIGILSCMCISGGQDVAIEFHSTSNSLEDLDHLVRRSTPIRRGNWNDDTQIQFSTVYLATEPALGHLRHFGSRFFKTEYEFHVLLRDPDNKVILTTEVDPTEALVRWPNVNFKALQGIRRVAVLNPANSPNNAVTVLLRTKLSHNIALGFGFRTLENGLLDVQHPWKAIVPIKNDCTLDDVSFGSGKVRTVDKENLESIMVDGAKIEIGITQQSWWARTSRNILISIVNTDTVPKTDDKPTFADSKESRTSIEAPGRTSFGSISSNAKKEKIPSSISPDNPRRTVVGSDYGKIFSDLAWAKPSDQLPKSLDETNIFDPLANANYNKIPSVMSYSQSSTKEQPWGYKIGKRPEIGMQWTKLELASHLRSTELDDLREALKGVEALKDTSMTQNDTNGREETTGKLLDAGQVRGGNADGKKKRRKMKEKKKNEDNDELD